MPDMQVNKGLEQIEMPDTRKFKVVAQQTEIVGKTKKLLASENNYTKGSDRKEHKLSQRNSQDIIQSAKETTKQKELEIKPVAIQLEDSLWSPKNRICDKSASFKAKIPSFKVPGETKEY